MLHQVQGAYYVKGFAKHGPLHNPHTYGYFDHVPYEGFKGGHVTCGGIVYQADAYPKEFHDQYIAGNLLSNAVYWHKIDAEGVELHGEARRRPAGRERHLVPAGRLLPRAGRVASTSPTGTTSGPPTSTRSTTGTRRTAASTASSTRGRSSRSRSTCGRRRRPSWSELLKHPNKWWRNEARRLLAERQDKSVVPQLKKQALEEKGLTRAGIAVGAVRAARGWTTRLASKLLDHPNEHVRAWAVRLIGDRCDCDDRETGRARIEPSVLELLTESVTGARLFAVNSRVPPSGCTDVAGDQLHSRLAESGRDDHRTIHTCPYSSGGRSKPPQPAGGSSWLATDCRVPFWKRQLVGDFLAERIAPTAAAHELASDASANVDTCSAAIGLHDSFARSLNALDQARRRTLMTGSCFEASSWQSMADTAATRGPADAF